MDIAAKRKVWISVCSLLLCFTLLVTASYAWITMSRAPEIIGIQTQVGANGSLEMALLSGETYADPSLIRSSVGDSLANADAVQSNAAWGNVVDLSDPSYGLSEIVMIPSRLNVIGGGQNSGVVSNNLLGTLRFGTDGRSEVLEAESVSVAWSENGFVYDPEKQDYGVRAIGSIPRHSLQQRALTRARGLVRTYHGTACDIMEAVWHSHGEDLLNIFQKRYSAGSNSFGAQDVTVLRDAIGKMMEVYGYFDAALRQSIIGYAASVERDAETFQALRDNVENTSIPLSLMMESVSGSLPSAFSQWITTIENRQMELRQAKAACDALTGGGTWADLSPVLDVLVKADLAYLGTQPLTSADAYTVSEEGVILTLPPDSGTLAETAEFCGNYSVMFDHTGFTAVEATTVSTLETPHLTQITQLLENCEAADSGGVVSGVELENIYGFAVDLAFRSNTDTQLLLQTDAALRVDGGYEQTQMQGGGSSLSFSSEQMETRQVVEMMDAMRIGFLDNQNRLLAVAKANSSNYTETADGVTAPLYLYDCEVSPGGQLLMGERRLEDACITNLTDGTAMVITVVVWLDGDYMSNSLVTSSDPHMEGKLNLQFASNVVLKPAHLDVEASE